MSRSRKSHQDDSDMRHSIRGNLRTIKQTIDAYETTPDSIEFTAETARLREELLKLALKYHVLINAKGSNELRKAAKQEDPKFAAELKELSIMGKKGGDKYIDALKNLDVEVALEAETVLNKVGDYKLSDDKLTELAAKAMHRVQQMTTELKKELQAEVKQPTPRSSVSSADNSPAKPVQRQFAQRDLLFNQRKTINDESKRISASISDEKPDDRPEESPNISKKK